MLPMRLIVTSLLIGITGNCLAEAPSFSREIQPILSNKCYFCHGPDPSHREAGLRLDRFEDAIAALEESAGHAIVPGDPAASMIIVRMRSKDPDTVMPPPRSHLAMEPQEIRLIERWIEAGAVYEDHWAFTPLPAEVAVPEPPNPAAVRNEIDHFVHARLARETLGPSPEAPAARLLRRVSIDLTGLPPMPAEIESFDPAGFEATVERLLASPHYGETMALQWLDAARYADSYGYQSDKLMPQWPWRDWVIQAFNENLPYDQFATWQLAGDLLPDAGRDQVLATAFNRLHRMTEEGGTIHEEMRVEGVADRIHTFGTTFLALTMECSRCHDHKYDPISARDYYALGAFFNSIAERGTYGHQNIVPGPALLLPNPAQEQQMAEAAAAVAAAAETLAAAMAEATPAEWPAELAALPGRVAQFNFDADDDPAANIGGLPLVDSPTGKAVRLDGDAGVSIPGLLEHDWPQPWTVDVVLRDPVANTDPVLVWHRSFGTDAGYNGIECFLADGRIEVRLVRDWPGSAVARITGPAITKDRWHRVSVTWDGSGLADGLAIYIDGELQPSTPTADRRLRQSITLRSHGNGAFTLGERFRERGFTGGEIDSLAVFGRVLAPLEVAELHQPGTLAAALADPAAAGDGLAMVFRAAHHAGVAEAREALRAARQRLLEIGNGVHTVAVMDDTPEPRPTWILERGVYDAPRSDENRVTRDTFEHILPPFPDDHPRNRLGLARWLTQPDHPLTARVFVNRVWQHFFGTGLVATSDNFGFQGSPPSHPELLDWLARDFVASGWDIKHLCRTIVLSATYRQESTPGPELRQRDPDNILLARGPARRLAAEPIRDLALAASGTLVPRLGGPPVSPYQPGDLWRESNSMSPAYRQSSGEDLFRRSIYSVWKRTAPLANAVIFDAAGRETCEVSRTSTNTPLQALVLLNDPQFVEPSRALAAAVMAEHPDDAAERLASAFLRLTARRPDAREAEILAAALEQQRGFFHGKPEETAAFLATGSIPADAALDPAELAATTVICQAILNLDAAIWKR